MGKLGKQERPRLENNRAGSNREPILAFDNVIMCMRCTTVEHPGSGSGGVAVGQVSWVWICPIGLGLNI